MTQFKYLHTQTEPGQDPEDESNAQADGLSPAEPSGPAGNHHTLFYAIIKPTDSRKSTYVIHGGARCRTAIHYESKWSFNLDITCSGCDKIVTTDYNNDLNYTTVKYLILDLFKTV